MCCKCLVCTLFTVGLQCVLLAQNSLVRAILVRIGVSFNYLASQDTLRASARGTAGQADRLVQPCPTAFPMRNQLSSAPLSWVRRWSGCLCCQGPVIRFSVVSPSPGVLLCYSAAGRALFNLFLSYWYFPAFAIVKRFGLWWQWQGLALLIVIRFADLWYSSYMDCFYFDCSQVNTLDYGAMIWHTLVIPALLLCCQVLFPQVSYLQNLLSFYVLYIGFTGGLR